MLQFNCALFAITTCCCLALVIGNEKSGVNGLYVRSTAKVIYGREKLRKKEKPDEQNVSRREERSLQSKGRIRIGVYTPLICHYLKKIQHSRKNRDLSKRHTVSSKTGKDLGFFSPIYCKGLESWINKKAKIDDIKPIDCLDVQRKVSKISGVYTVYPKGSEGFDVYCDMSTSNGGWTVIQRRMDGSVRFYRNWKDYVEGFGNLEGEFWLGNDRIHLLTNQGKTKLRVNLQDFDGNSRYATYSRFNVASGKNKYKLTVIGYAGSAGDAMAHNNGRYFSTPDKDNDNTGGNCAVGQKGAWWHGTCSNANLNGLYQYGRTQSKWQAVIWDKWRGSQYSLKAVAMLIRRE